MYKFSLPRLLSLLVIICCTTFGATRVEAQEEKDFSLDVTFNSDQFFGFYPFFQGSYKLSDNVSFTFYGILWSGGSGGRWGNWTEFGVGASFEAIEGLSITPQIGILGGSLLSSGAQEGSILGDGIVPNITVNLDKDNIESELYAGFYLPLRDNTTMAQTTLSYLHFWANAGYQLSSFMSVGAHFEQLTNTGGSNVPEATDIYQWVGPYIQFSKPGGGAFVRFVAGTDLVEGNDSFFKVTLGFGL